MNGKFSGMLLASDLDGTLLDHKRQISPQNREALQYFVGQGGAFTVATGRTLKSAREYCEALPLTAPCVFLNGAVVYDYPAQKLLYMDGMPSGAKTLVRMLLAEFPGLGVEIYTLDEIFACQMNAVTREHFQLLHVDYMTCSVEEMAEPETWGKVNLTGDIPLLAQVKRFLQPYQDVYEMAASNPLFYEITAREDNKGAGVRRSAAALGIGQSHIFTVGDSSNDLPMLHGFGQSFAPQNAEPEVCQMAVQRVSHHDEHALRDVVAWLDSRAADLAAR